jgi:hypothetical protein
MAEFSPAEREQHRYNYDYRVAPYDAPDGRADAPNWLKDETAARSIPRHADGTPRLTSAPKPPEVFPDAPVAGAVPKNAALYCLLGIIIPGLPSLLIRKDKVVGAIQLGLWILAWPLTIVLIGFLLWPAAAIWAAVTGYQDAQLWNRRHGFVT